MLVVLLVMVSVVEVEIFSIITRKEAVTVGQLELLNDF